MSEHSLDARFNDYLDDLLDESERASLEEAIRRDPEARRRLERMVSLRDELGDLPQEAQPPRDLWSGIASRIGPASNENVIALEPRRSRRASRISLTIGQLAAAGIVLALVSGGSVWYGTAGNRQISPDARSAVAVVPISVGSSAALADYENAAAELQLVVDRGRQVLAPETLEVIEESLLAIDQAIEEAREALRDDPGSEILERILATDMKKKLDLLRQAAAMVQSVT